MLPKLETISPAWTDYELLDTGSGRKLERFGSVTLTRPEPQADWPPALPERSWNAAHANFIQQPRSKNGEWKFRQSVPSRWPMTRKNLSFWVEPTPSGHLGVFPDQACHWDWLASLIASAAPPRVLSLFGYTGLATLATAAAGANLTHVDASRKAIKWARENQSLSQLTGCPIRWLVDDAQSFVEREVRRGRTYDGLILDPPRFGRGPKGELWKMEKSLPALLRQCRKLLSPTPLFVLLNIYTTVLTRGQTAKEAAQLHFFLKETLRDYPATLTSGELVLTDSANRQISNSVFARAHIRP
ncbi:MAG TPA: class I SAM-dependent methyltransferase [Verrucomicrobiae bacterium]|jgi:23S rRNA (cytosine1962-C5)-methyltransferase|nr:class I SAM-dependent methyltransferase [Verrucomicrobiae bacterium]